MAKSRNRKDHKKKSLARSKKIALELAQLKKKFVSWADKREQELKDKENTTASE